MIHPSLPLIGSSQRCVYAENTEDAPQKKHILKHICFLSSFFLRPLCKVLLLILDKVHGTPLRF